MSRETYREFGKLLLDFSKISGGLGLLLPYLQRKDLRIYEAIVALIFTVLFIMVGLALLELSKEVYDE